MKSMLHTAWAVSLATVAGAASAAASVEISFIEPQRYTDAGGDSRSERERNLKTLEGQLVAASARRLGDGQVLKVEVLDVDLAGTVRHNLPGGELRIANGGADWPRITLRYSLQERGQVVGTGEDTLIDMDYLHRLGNRWTASALQHEKRLIDAWAVRRFGGKAPAGT